MSERKRRRVVLIQPESEAVSLRLRYEDGESQAIVLIPGSDLLLAESKPMAPCMECGDSSAIHGDWEYDGTDEFWVSGPCHSDDGCPNFEPFVPRRKGMS